MVRSIKRNILRKMGLLPFKKKMNGTKVPTDIMRSIKTKYGRETYSKIANKYKKIVKDLWFRKYFGEEFSQLLKKKERVS